VNGDEWWVRIGFRKLIVFREAVNPHLLGGDRSNVATLFTLPISSKTLTINMQGIMINLFWDGLNIQKGGIVCQEKSTTRRPQDMAVPFSSVQAPARRQPL
jgi:hypothetical protein